MIYVPEYYTVNSELLTYNMTLAKKCLCKNCEDVHQHPINSKCPFQAKNNESVHVSGELPVHSEDAGELNMQILAELKSLGGRMSAMEKKMASKEATEVTRFPQ